MARTIKKRLFIVILNLAHLLWATCIQIQLYLILLYYYVASSRYFNKLYGHYDDYIKELTISNNTKQLPQHLALCLTNENRNFNLASIVNLIIWSKQIGINYITLYDDHGKLAEQQKHLEDILLERSGKPIDKVRILSRSDGRPKFVNLIRNLSTLPKDKINLNFVNEQVTESDGCPHPELLIIFGVTSSIYGYPPWQLKTTEIFHLPTHRNISLDSFVGCLEQYAKVEKRVGV